MTGRLSRRPGANNYCFFGSPAYILKMEIGQCSLPERLINKCINGKVYPGLPAPGIDRFLEYIKSRNLSGCNARMFSNVFFNE